MGSDERTNVILSCSSKEIEKNQVLSKSEIYGNNEITNLDINENCDHFKNLNFSFVEKNSDQIQKHPTMANYHSARSFASPIKLFNVSSKIKKYEYHSFEYYLNKIILNWWQFKNYLTDDLFSHYNRSIFTLYFLFFLLLLFIHVIVFHVLISQYHMKQYELFVDRILIDPSIKFLKFFRIII